jgi:hypothetical protein
MSSPISIELDAVEGLAAELALLAAELDDDAELCRSTAVSFATALEGDEGWTSGAAATAWGSLTAVVAARTGAVASTLTAATAAYRSADRAMAADGAMAGGTAGPRAPGAGPGPR